MIEIKLVHYSPANGVALIHHDGAFFRLEPPYRSENAHRIEADLKESSKWVQFEDLDVLRVFLAFKNSLFVSVSVRDFIKKESLRPETIATAEDLQGLLTGIIKDDLKNGEIHPKTPIAMQIHQTLFHSEEFERTALLERLPSIPSWSNSESAEKLLIMSGHEKFDYAKWIIPSIIEIEQSWIPQEKFADLQNWILFVNKFLDLELSQKAQNSIKTAYSKTSELQRIQKFIKDGRHKVKDWQKSAKFVR